MIKKAHYIKNKHSLPKLPYRKQIYGYFTDAGINRGRYGNFISYAMNSQKIFDEKSPRTRNLMMSQISNRRKKIGKMLGYQIHF